MCCRNEAVAEVTQYVGGPHDLLDVADSELSESFAELADGGAYLGSNFPYNHYDGLLGSSKCPPKLGLDRAEFGDLPVS
jgi:hypothetical protein